MNMRAGIDALGLGHPLFPLQKLFKDLDRSTPVGFFWSTFGDSREKLNWMIAEGFTTFRIQVYWSDSHTIVPMNILRTELEEIRNATAPHKDRIKLYVSPSCEHAEKNGDEVKRRLDLTKELLPYAKVVNNPWKNMGAHVPGYLIEYHGKSAGVCDLASTDGENCYDMDIVSWVKKHCNREHPAFLWGSRFNLREIGDPGQKPPPIKNRRAAPSLQYLRGIVRLGEPYGTPPEPKFECKPFREPNLWKQFSEDDQEPNENDPDELRENRPVLIIRPNVPTVSIIDCNGAPVGKLQRYGDFPGGLTRYYAGTNNSIGLYGFQIGKEAKQQSGSEFVWFRAGSNIVGPVNPSFRAGSFR